MGPLASGTTKVRLPKISLPRFNGNPVRWDLYLSAIHLDAGLSDVDKFNYLRSLLDSTAFNSITLSSAKYQQAIEVLHKRFGNKQVIISKHMDTLMNMNTFSSDRHLRDLRQLYDNTESHVCSLKSLGIEAASYGTLLSPVLLAKLPPDLRLIVNLDCTTCPSCGKGYMNPKGFSDHVLNKHGVTIPSIEWFPKELKR
jgi:hypothetical protein